LVRRQIRVDSPISVTVWPLEQRLRNDSVGGRINDAYVGIAQVRDADENLHINYVSRGVFQDLVRIVFELETLAEPKIAELRVVTVG
jgi:hypothetical protein